MVGAGHLPGMRDCWNAEIDLAALVTVPPARRGWPWGRIALITAAVSLTGTAVWVVRARARR